MLSDTKVTARREEARRGEANYTNWEMASALDRCVTIFFFATLGLLPGGLIVGFCESRNSSGEYLLGAKPQSGFWLIMVIGTIFIELVIMGRLIAWYNDRPYDYKFKQQTAARTRS